MKERLKEEARALVHRVQNPEEDGLLSYTERIMVAIASEDLTRAPGRLKEECPRSWIEAFLELGEDQLAVLRVALQEIDADLGQSGGFTDNPPDNQPFGILE